MVSHAASSDGEEDLKEEVISYLTLERCLEKVLIWCIKTYEGISHFTSEGVGTE